MWSEKRGGLSLVVPGCDQSFPECGSNLTALEDSPSFLVVHCVKFVSYGLLPMMLSSDINEEGIYFIWH